MGLDTSNTASTLYNKISELYNGSGEDFYPFLNSVIDDAFQGASLDTNNFDISGPAGSLQIPVDDGVIYPDKLADEICRYWGDAIDPGTPESCNNIDSVTNTASDIKDSIVNGLISLYSNSANGVVSDPPFYEFIDIIFSAVKDIEWTIEESDSDCSATFTSKVS